MNEDEYQKIVNSKELEISSSRAIIQQIILFLLLPITIFLFIKFSGANQHPFALIFAILFICFMIFMSTRLHNATLVGTKIKFKQIFSKEFEINISDIIELDSMRIGKGRYLSITFLKDNIKKTVWIMKPSYIGGRTSPDVLIQFAFEYFSSEEGKH